MISEILGLLPVAFHQIDDGSPKRENHPFSSF